MNYVEHEIRTVLLGGAFCGAEWLLLVAAWAAEWCGSFTDLAAKLTNSFRNFNEKKCTKIK